MASPVSMPTRSAASRLRAERPTVTLADRIAAAGTFDAWLCDLDGTLAATMALHYRAYAAVFARLGGTLSRADFDALVGPPARVTIPLFARAAGLDLSAIPTTDALHSAKKAELDELVAAGEVEPLEAAALVLDAPDHIRIAVVTSGNRQGATAIIAAIGLKKRVSFIISGDDVTHGKPDPEPYALAAERLGIAPDRCLVLEDHPDGIASATAAGMTVIDVTESATMAALR